MDKSPAFQFYAGDWFDIRVLRMTLEARGAYIQLLAHMWKDSPDQCSIENEIQTISRALGVTKRRASRIMAEIQKRGDPIFKKAGNRLVSKRLQREKALQLERFNAKSGAGKKGAESRWHRHDPAIGKGVAGGMAKGMANDGPSPSSSTARSAIATSIGEGEQRTPSPEVLEKARTYWRRYAKAVPKYDSPEEEEFCIREFVKVVGKYPEEIIFAALDRPTNDTPFKVTKEIAKKGGERKLIDDLPD